MQAGDHLLDDRDIVLEVGVDGDDRVAGRVGEPGEQGALMAAVAAELDAVEAVGPGCGQFLDQRPGLVARTVVDEIDGAWPG